MHQPTRVHPAFFDLGNLDSTFATREGLAVGTRSVGPDRGASRRGAFCANELANFLAGSLQYKEQWRKQFKQAEHVNCKELRAYCTRNVASPAAQ